MKYIGKSKKGFSVYEYNREEFKNDEDLKLIESLFEVTELESYLKGEISYEDFHNSFQDVSEDIDDAGNLYFRIYLLEHYLLSIGGKL